MSYIFARRTILRSVPVLLAMFALVLSGCGDSSPADSDTDPASTPANSALAATVPDAVREKGTLTVATNAAQPPYSFLDTDGTTLVGVEPDLGDALGDLLGLEFEFVAASFDSIIPGLLSERYDLAMAGMLDTKEREENLDFVTYVQTGSVMVVRAEDDGPQPTRLADLCGLTVAVQSGSKQAFNVEEQVTKCTDAGEPAPEAKHFADESKTILALTSGRVDVLLSGEGGMRPQVEASDGALAITGEAYGLASSGIAIPKDNGMAEPLRDAMNELIENGTYTEIMNEHGIGYATLQKSEINGATQ